MTGKKTVAGALVLLALVSGCATGSEVITAAAGEPSAASQAASPSGASVSHPSVLDLRPRADAAAVAALGTDGSAFCARAEVRQVLSRLSPSFASLRGGFLTDSHAVWDWRAAYYGDVGHPAPGVLAGQPTNLMVVCWYAGTFTDSDLAVEGPPRTFSDVVVSYDLTAQAGLVEFETNGSIPMVAPPPPSVAVLNAAREDETPGHLVPSPGQPASS